MFEDKINNKKEKNTISDSVNNFNYNINKFLVFDINNKNFKITNKGEIKLKLYSKALLEFHLIN